MVRRPRRDAGGVRGLATAPAHAEVGCRGPKLCADLRALLLRGQRIQRCPSPQRGAMASRPTPAKSKSRFQVCAEEFCESYFKCSYQCHLQEKPSSSNVRTFIATFSKPTLLTPAPPAVVRVNLEVVYEGGGCKVSRFKVDGSSHWLDSETPFQELWFDRARARAPTTRRARPTPRAPAPRARSRHAHPTTRRAHPRRVHGYSRAGRPAKARVPADGVARRRVHGDAPAAMNEGRRPNRIRS